MTITTVGLDLAKNVFQAHGVDERSKAGLRKQLKRGQMAVDSVNQHGRSCCLTKECYPSVCCRSWFCRSSIVEGCGHVGEGGSGGQRKALSTGEPGAPQAQRPHVHSLPGA